MTEQQIPEQGGTAPFIVKPDGRSRLAQLHAAYPEAKAAADAAAERLKTITDGIKAELTAAAPEGQRRLALVGNGPALTLTYSESWRIDSTRLKAENPEVYVRYAKKSSSWSLRQSATGGE